MIYVRSFGCADLTLSTETKKVTFGYGGNMGTSIEKAEEAFGRFFSDLSNQFFRNPSKPDGPKDVLKKMRRHFPVLEEEGSPDYYYWITFDISKALDAIRQD